MIQNKCKTTLVLGRKGAKVLRMKISEMITDRYKLRIPPTVYYDLLADVQEAEEEQELRKGHWIPTYGNVKCSVCGSVKDSREVSKATHYCDFCGAKMESEEV